MCISLSAIFIFSLTIFCLNVSSQSGPCLSVVPDGWKEGIKYDNREPRMEGKAPDPGRSPAPSKVGSLRKERRRSFGDCKAENDARTSCGKNAAVKKRRRTKQSPQRPVWKGQLDSEQPSASASPRKHRGGLPGYTPGVKGGEWRVPERQRWREGKRERSAKCFANQRASVELRQCRDQPSS